MTKILTVTRKCSVKLTEDDIKTAILGYYEIPSHAEISIDNDGDTCATWTVFEEHERDIGQKEK